jgi:2-polyprenyl-3-methyl-5-hydroxy-6-metoxy-1,4-benzoquinol methylase
VYGQRVVKDFYEDLWQRMPAELDPPDLARRRAFLLAGLRPGERVLDLGCGAGVFTSILAQAGARPVGMEIAQAALTRARAEHPGLDFRLAPLEGPLPAAEHSFEVVWGSELIEHVADTARWLSEVRRVLVPGGRLLLTTPNHPRLAILLHGLERYSEPLGDHLHLYTRRSLEALLGEFGFAQISVRAVGGAPAFRRLLLASARR